MEEVLDGAEQQAREVIELVTNDLKTVKTGRAKPSLIEDVRVRAYGEDEMTLRELASITAPDPHFLVVSPWDKTIIDKIEKAISLSDLHLTPTVDNDLIRVAVPPLTEETRRELVKLVYQKLESGRKLIRQVRNDAKREIEEKKGEAGVSEDDIHRGLKKLQETIDRANKELEDLGAEKEKELMRV